MKQITLDRSIVVNGQSLPINTDAARKLGCYVDILKRLHNQISAMLDRYCKVHIIFFNFQLHEYQPNNETASDLMRVIKKQLKRHYGGEMAYSWVRETGASGIPHYHIALMLNGNLVNNQHCLRGRIFKIFEERDQARPHFSRGEHTILRNSPESWADAFYHLSYLAKVSTKGNKPHYTNDYSLTRLARISRPARPIASASAIALHTPGHFD